MSEKSRTKTRFYLTQLSPPGRPYEGASLQSMVLQLVSAGEIGDDFDSMVRAGELFVLIPESEYLAGLGGEDV